jgi:hypothetical protein
MTFSRTLFNLGFLTSDDSRLRIAQVSHPERGNIHEAEQPSRGGGGGASEGAALTQQHHGHGPGLVRSARSESHRIDTPDASSHFTAPPLMSAPELLYTTTTARHLRFASGPHPLPPNSFLPSAAASLRSSFVHGFPHRIRSLLCEARQGISPDHLSSCLICEIIRLWVGF